MGRNLLFRPAEASDFDAVRELSASLARHIEASPPAFTDAQFAARYVGPDAPMHLLLAIDGDGVRGLITWTVTYELYSGDARLYISDLVVAPDARGRGTGAALMAEVIRWARSRNIAKLGWEVWYRNETAMAFYEAMGASRDREALPYVIEVPA